MGYEDISKVRSHCEEELLAQFDMLVMWFKDKDYTIDRFWHAPHEGTESAYCLSLVSDSDQEICIDGGCPVDVLTLAAEEALDQMVRDAQLTLERRNQYKTELEPILADDPPEERAWHLYPI